MYLSDEEKLEMRDLSQQVFGSPNKWRKILDKGLDEVVTTMVDETVPGVDGAEPTTRKVEVPVKATQSGGKLRVKKYYTFEALKTWMLELKVRRDEVIAQIKKMQEEQKAAEEAQKRKEQELQAATGSVV